MRICFRAGHCRGGDQVQALQQENFGFRRFAGEEELAAARSTGSDDRARRPRVIRFRQQGTGRYRAVVSEVRCCGCGAIVPDVTGPVHAYMPSSPGCWALYCGLEDWKASLSVGHDAPTLVQHLVDSYAAQHSDSPDRRNRQSVAVHLISLCASLEQGIPGARLRQLIGTWTHREYPLLVPRPDAYQLTVRDLADARGLPFHAASLPNADHADSRAAILSKANM